MEDIHSIHLQRLHDRLGEILYQLAGMRFPQVPQPASWSPAINAYRCSRQITICVDLAGVDKSALDLQVTPSNLRIRGRREPPEPAGAGEKPLQVLAMEIDYGPFEREVALPQVVDTENVTAEQRNGLLWVHLPLVTPA